MQHQTGEMAKVIVVDWGTTTLRAILVGHTGIVIAHTESERGIQFFKDGDFQAALLGIIGPWLDMYGPISVIALGMITSKNGWIEVPYVPCPATLQDLAAGTVCRQLPNGSEICFLAGISDPNRKPFKDVMRGEETQILGYGLTEETIVVLPGTHCKWAKLSEGQIDGFQTFVTGELYALLSKHAFIAKAGAECGNDEDWDAFAQGATVALEAEGADAAFLAQLFTVRTGMLAGELSASSMKSYLSGLLIGEEFRQAQIGGWFKAGDTIGIVGNDDLSARYKRVAEIFDLDVRQGSAQSVVIGALKVHRKRKANAAY